MTTSEELLNIETPENVVLGYELVGLGARFLATLVDTLLFGLALFFINLLVLVISVSALDELAAGWLIAIFGALNFLIYLGYFALFELVWNGQTPGKRLFNLRVLGADGLPLDLSAALIRNFVRLIDFLPVAYGIGVITMFFSQRGQRLGDYAAGTIVVYDRQLTLRDVTRQTRPEVIVSAELLADFDLPVARLDEADVQLAEALLARRYALGTDRELLRPVLARLYTRMGVELEPQLTYSDAVNRLQMIVTKRRQPAQAAR